MSAHIESRPDRHTHIQHVCTGLIASRITPSPLLPRIAFIGTIRLNGLSNNKDRKKENGDDGQTVHFFFLHSFHLRHTVHFR